MGFPTSLLSTKQPNQISKINIKRYPNMMMGHLNQVRVK